MIQKDEVDGEVSWVGSLTCDRQVLHQFVETMLYTKGLAVESRQQGGIEVLAVRAIKPS